MFPLPANRKLMKTGRNTQTPTEAECSLSIVPLSHRRKEGRAGLGLKEYLYQLLVPGPDAEQSRHHYGSAFRGSKCGPRTSGLTDNGQYINTANL